MGSYSPTRYVSIRMLCSDVFFYITFCMYRIVLCVQPCSLYCCHASRAEIRLMPRITFHCAFEFKHLHTCGFYLLIASWACAGLWILNVMRGSADRNRERQ